MLLGGVSAGYHRELFHYKTSVVSFITDKLISMQRNWNCHQVENSRVNMAEGFQGAYKIRPWTSKVML